MSGEPCHTESTAYVLVLDVGTSTIRAHVYDNKTVIRGMGSSKVMPYTLPACNKYYYIAFYLFNFLVYGLPVVVVYLRKRSHGTIYGWLPNKQ